jgi:chromosome condensin MukBEF MukE localization factor
MLPLYSNAVAKRQFTVVYRGYDLDLTRAPSGWCVGVHPKTADLPIIGRSVLADDQDQAVVGAKGRIDGALSLLACSI